jgi:hypothetical protein
MEKIRLKPNETAVITANNTTYVLGGDVSIEIKGNTGNDHPDQERLLTIKEIVDAEADKSGSFISDDCIKDYPLSGYGEHYRDTHTAAQAHKLVALAEMMRIADYYNEHYADGWKQDNDNPQQMKYMIFNKRDEFEPDSYHFNMFGLPTFATKELAQIALDNNREVFERFFAV